MLVTIHQPASEMFPLFDRFLFLAKGMVCSMHACPAHSGMSRAGLTVLCGCAGEVVFSGTGPQALAHFASIGHECPAFTNPLDHIIDISSTDTRSEAAEVRSAEQV